MPVLFQRWMTARSLDESVGLRASITTSADGGRYAQELRDIARRLRAESEIDMEQPDRELRYRTLDALHEAYILHPRLTAHDLTPPRRLVFPTSIRTAARLAACIALVVGGSWLTASFGPAVLDSTRNHLATLRATPSNHVLPAPAVESPHLAGGPTSVDGELPLDQQAAIALAAQREEQRLAAEQHATRGAAGGGTQGASAPITGQPRAHDATAARDHRP